MPEGIFLDGVTYAAVSRNLAMGKGTFWALYYRHEWIFSEHPPLFFGLQAIFFKILGDHYLTEKIYSFVIWAITAVFISKLWNKTNTNHQSKYSFGLPLLLWCIIPTITWGYTNNILDCTMALFDLIAVYLLYRTLSSANERKYSIPVLTISAILTFCALMTKGPVGAFPLAVPSLYWLVYNMGNGKLFTKAVAQTVFMSIVIAAIYFVMYQFPESKANLDRYMNEQLMAALSGKREITGGGLGRFTLLYELAMQMLVPAVPGVVLFVTVRLLRIQPLKQTGAGKHALFFLLVGVAASLPIMLSVKQRTFYLVPSLPFYVLALTVFIYPYFAAITERLKVSDKGLKYFSISAVVAIAGLCIYLGSKVGQIGRDKELITNMHYLAEKFPSEQVFGICSEAEKDYQFLAYLERYNKMEVSPVFYTAEYVLIDKEVCNNDIIPLISKIGFREESIELNRYKLFRRHFPLKFDFTLLNPVFRTRDK